MVLRDNPTSTSGNDVATWYGQAHQWFFLVPYIILISAESTVPELFILLLSTPFNLITLPNQKYNITALGIILFSETWYDFQILLVTVDSFWNTRRRLYYYEKSRKKQLAMLYTTISHSLLGYQSHLCRGYQCSIDFQTWEK